MMEFSFEYTEFWRAIDENQAITYSIAFGGILLLYLPVRLITTILELNLNGKTHAMSVLYLGFTWLMGCIVLGVLSFAHPTGIQVFLIYLGIVVTVLSFALSNHKIIYKVYKTLYQGGTV